MTLLRLPLAWLAFVVCVGVARADEPPAPGAEPGAPTVPPPLPLDPHAPISSDDPTLHYAVALHGRYLALPGFMLAPFLQQYTTLSSGEFGADFVRRKGSLDITVGVNLGFYSLPDGNFLGSDKDPTLDTHYVQFRGLDILALDVMFQYHKDLTSWLEVVVGGGVGLGVLMGDIYLINNSSSICTAANAGDPTKCHPIANDPQNDPKLNALYTYTNSSGQMMQIGQISPNDPDFQRKLDATAAAYAQCQQLAAANPSSTAYDCRDTAHHPFYHATGDKPPVVPMISFIVGFRFKLERHWNVNVNAGFHDGWVFGGGPEYVF